MAYSFGLFQIAAAADYPIHGNGVVVVKS